MFFMDMSSNVIEETCLDREQVNFCTNILYAMYSCQYRKSSLNIDSRFLETVMLSEITIKQFYSKLIYILYMFVFNLITDLIKESPNLCS